MKNNFQYIDIEIDKDDFFFDPKPLTKKEQKLISDFIRADKEKRKSQKTLKKGTYTQHEI
jgi:hypothetical protein